MPQSDLTSANKNNSILNLEVYQSEVRDKVVKFCGWLPSTMQQKDLRRVPADRMPNMQVYEAVKQTELSIRGGVMRAVVMAALNFDFEQAQRFLSHSDTVSAYNEDSTTIMNF